MIMNLGLVYLQEFFFLTKQWSLFKVAYFPWLILEMSVCLAQCTLANDKSSKAHSLYKYRKRSFPENVGFQENNLKLLEKYWV